MIHRGLRSPENTPSASENALYPEGNWKISEEFKVKEGSLKAVTVSQSGNIYLGGDSFVSCYDKDLESGMEDESPGTGYFTLFLW